MPRPEKDDNEELSLRDQLGAAFDESGEEVEKKDGVAGVEGGDETNVEGVEGVEKEGKVEGVEKELPEGEEKPAKEKTPVEKGKDGKFKAKTPEASVEDETPEAKVQLPKSRAPGSWKPAAREKWAALPADIQQEVIRREREIANGFNEVAEVKKFRQDFGQVMTQHQGIINAEGGDGMKMTRDLFQTAATLYNGNPQGKAMTVAAMIKNFGVDIQLLDSILAGQIPAQGQQGPQQNHQQGNQSAEAYIAQAVKTQVAAILGPQTQQMEGQVATDIDTFAADPKNDFFDDVRDDMADLLELAAKRGKKLSLQDAYNTATMANSEIAGIINERNQRTRAATGNTAAAQARKRAVSVKNTPSKELASGDEGSDKPASLRDAIGDAIEQLAD